MISTQALTLKLHRQLATASEDAFDAAVSALVMAASVEELLALRDEPDDGLEGRIWQPCAPVELPRSEPEPPPGS